ncbi:MAG: hypothetical protein ACQESN_09840 [Thermotogota bacterium]
MDFKWVIIPIIAVLTLGFVSTTGKYRGPVYPQEHSRQYNSNLYETKDRISIKGVNLNIKFVRGDDIYISHIDQAHVRTDSIEIETPKFPFRNEVLIEIGRDHNYEEIKISGVKIDLEGRVETEELKIDGTSISLNSEIDAEQINISGTGINVKGYMHVENFRISGTGININFKTSYLEKFVVSSTGVTGKIIFLNNWRNDSKITLSSLGGDVDFEIPTKSRGYLDINTSGNIRTNTKYY